MILIKTVCQKHVDINKYTEHVVTCDTCLKTYNSILQNPILQEIVDEHDVVYSKLHKCICERIMYLTGSLFDPLYKHIIKYGPYKYSAQKHICVCGFRTDKGNVFRKHKEVCEQYQQHKEYYLSENVLINELQNQTAYEYAIKHNIEYSYVLDTVKRLSASGKLEYDFRTGFANSHVASKTKQTMKHKYGVDNPSRLETVRQKQREAQLKNWYNIEYKKNRCNSLYETRGIFNVQQDFDTIQQLTKQLGITDHFELVKLMFNKLRNNEFVELQVHSIEDFYQHCLGDGRTNYSFKCKRCGLQFNKYIASPVSFLTLLYVHDIPLNHIVSCPKCDTIKKSQLEYIILNNIAQKYSISSVQHNVKVDNTEIDLVLNNRCGIEVDGIYWHSTQSIKAQVSSFEEYLEQVSLLQKRLTHKFSVYKTMPYNVITIPEYLWQRYTDSYLSRVGFELNQLSNKISARQCTIQQVSHHIANQFHDKYNIRGKIMGANIHIALVHNDRIVSVMSLGQSRQCVTHDDRIELLRYTVLPYTVVQGGYRKLLAYVFRNVCTEVVSFIDACWHSKRPKNCRILEKPKPTYFVVDHCTKTMHHRLYLRKLLRNQNCTESEFIFKTTRYDLYFTHGSWKVLLT